MDATSIIVKSSIILSAFLLVYYVFLHKETHFNNNRIFLLIGLISTFILPFTNITYTVYAQINTPEIVETITTTNHTLSQLPAQKEVVIATKINWKQVLLWMYVALSIFFALRLVATIINTLWLSKTAEVLRWKSTKIYLHPSVKNPMVLGRRIFVKDKSYLQPDKVQILIHEQIHKDHNHWIDLLTIEILLIFAWFNPIAFLYRKAVLNNLEYIADRGVLNTGLQLNTYIQSILCETMGAETIMLANHFRTSQNKQRLKMMKIVKQSKWGRFSLLMILPMLGLMLWAFSEPEYILKEKQREYVSYEDIKHEKTDSIKFILSSTNADTVEVRQKDGTYKRMIVAGQIKNAKLTIRNKTITEIPLPLGGIDLKVNVGDTLIGSADGHEDKVFIYNGQGNTFLSLNPDNRTLIKGRAVINDTMVVRKEDGTYVQQIVAGSFKNVNVAIKGSSMGTFTDDDGKFELKVNIGDILVFSHVGYKTEEYKFIGKEELTAFFLGEWQLIQAMAPIKYDVKNTIDTTVVRKEDGTFSVRAKSKNEISRKDIIGKWTVVKNNSEEVLTDEFLSVTFNSDSTATMNHTKHGKKVGEWYWNVEKKIGNDKLNLKTNADVYFSAMLTENHSIKLLLMLDVKNGIIRLNGGKFKLEKE